jgi:hypothetical protein
MSRLGGREDVKTHISVAASRPTVGDINLFVVDRRRY